MSVALALLALLAVLAGPGLRGYLQDCRRTATVNALTHAVHAARRLAGVRGLPVELCPSTDGIDCSGALDWRGDLLLRTGTDGAALRVIALSLDGAHQTVRGNRPLLRFAPLAPSATTATLTVCDDRGPRAATAVIVSRSGRPRVAGRDASGRPLVCP
jgi:type IV fimbrial biogenesis protein FimT